MTDRRPTLGLSATTCVVTGGLGFIGSNLVHRLVGAGATVRVIDALYPEHGGDRRNVAGAACEIAVADIADPIVEDIVRGADVIFNVAGQVSHTASMRDPLFDLHVNAVSHASFLETVRRTNPTARIVYTSTRQVYGRAEQLPVGEAHSARPVDVNGVAKWAGEQLHMVYAAAHGMAATALRLTNVYGPRQRLTSNELGFLPVFIRAALTGADIELFGDGSQRRDCLFVDDVVDAVLAATSGACVGEVFNVGHSDDHALADIAAELIRSSGSRGAVRCRPWPADHKAIDIGSFRTDGSKFAAATGWSATTSLNDGIGATLAFYRGNQWYLSST